MAQSTKSSAAPRPELLSVESLDFDPQNPRFFDAFAGLDQQDAQAIQRMIDEENIQELVGSIGQQGYFPGEPLLVTASGRDAGRFIVVEGNRRLTALRILCGLVSPDLLPPSLVQLAEQAQHHPSEAECLVFPQRRDILKYLGFRHISGPRRWEPLSKARYLADLIQNFYTDLDPEGQLRAVAKDIGSRRDYVAQLLTALNIYDRAKASDYYGLQHVSEKDINFSFITTALSYRNIVDYLGLESREDSSLSGIKDDSVRDLLSWMFAQNQQGDTVLGESRRLKQLAAVVGSPTAVVELKKTGNLDHAYIYTSGPADALKTLLESAERNLSDCTAMVGSDVALDDHHKGLVERIIESAENLELLITKTLQRRERAKRAAEAARDE